MKMNFINFNRLPHRAAWNDLIDEVFNAGPTTPRSNNKPAINIREMDESYSIEVAAPGLEKEDFEIKVEKDQLLVSVNKEKKTEEVKDKYTRKEFSFMNFKRSFHLPETLNADGIEANYEAGILMITIPKKAEEVAKPKKIAVS